MAHAGAEHLDPAFVAGYDRKQGYPDPAGDLAVFAAHGLGATSAVLDLGAGSGQFALAAARRFGHVTAVDVSPVMVALLGERAAAAGLANLDCVQAGFLSYEHSGPPVDGVYTRNALHQLPDFWKAVALDRIAAMMRPGGVLRLRDLIFDFRPAEAAQVFRAGSSTPRPIRPPVTPPRTTRSTSAPSSARSAGCSSRCWPRPVLRSCPPTSAAGCTAPTPAASCPSKIALAGERPGLGAQRSSAPVSVRYSSR